MSNPYSTLDFDKEHALIASTMNNIAVIVGVVKNATFFEIKVSLDKAESTYTVWKTIKKPKHTYTFIDKELPDLASTMIAFDQALLKAGYVLSATERWVIEMRLRNEVGDNMDVVFFGKRHPEMPMYDNDTYAREISWGWHLSMGASNTYRIEYCELDSFETEEGQITRLFQLKHPNFIKEHLLIRNCSKESEPTAADSVLAMGDILQIFAVAYEDKALAWNKYMQAKMEYACRNLFLTERKGNKT